ncbi:beta-1,4-galactosyltransferase 3 isoform X2 [Eurytemora carolleeae]|uniref:beta-1,4-galactosyltransferase 3 isoform X2 n=1 Tax=Eurytemora carolleeae TaxID=1294199 RepID=UPI000C7912E4|nr:beta-1,4-galactosyltransferase 3 isoform X2 [Eurytemora carolleeae]|eukprot:XP_023328273.1 beta-1,4-galactosyltransferase 3-like isoform X2 [Eurytemora affinis]
MILSYYSLQSSITSIIVSCLIIISLVPLPAEWVDKRLDEVEKSWADRLGPGGVYTPTHCSPTSRIAILIPYRNRTSHLAHFLDIMHPFLQRQNLQYVVVVVNQTGNAPFMRGLLFNAGYKESLDHLSFKPDCIILHDVDHLPEREGMVYYCSQHGVTHLSHAVDRFDYNLFMTEYTGGVSGMTRLQYESINGFSNMYLGWGCEDEDLYIRIKNQDLTLIRIPTELSRYTTMPHVPNYPNWFWDQTISGLDRKRYPNLQEIVDTDGANTDRYDYNKYLQAAAPDRIDEEGLNNVRNFYTQEGVIFHNSFTEIQISPALDKIHASGLHYIAEYEAKLDKELKEEEEKVS